MNSGDSRENFVSHIAGSLQRRVRVALLDDHELLLDGLANWIQANEPRFELSVVAGTWVDLVRSPEFPTDLVLMDVQLQERISIEARVRTCRAAGATVIVLTAMDTQEDRERALDAGAAAYLLKAQPVREVMATVRSVLGLDTELGTSTGRAAGEKDVKPRPRISATGSEIVSTIRPKLSEGETIALRLYTTGKTTVQVAKEMNVGYETAKTFLRRIRDKYTKVGRRTSSRTDLIRRAAEDGYLD